jgi:hypothetical protein
MGSQPSNPIHKGTHLITGTIKKHADLLYTALLYDYFAVLLYDYFTSLPMIPLLLCSMNTLHLGRASRLVIVTLTSA